MKKLLAILAATGMVISLVGCGNGGNASDGAPDNSGAAGQAETGQTEDGQTGGTDEPITLRMAWWGSQTRHDITVEVIEMYEKEHPNIDIEYEFFSFDDYFTKLKTLVASDQVWDIFQLGGNFPMYMDKIYPLNDFISSGVVDVSKIGDANLKITQDTEGNQLGLSNGLNAYGIAYDVDMFNDAGIPLPETGWTWDDYAAAA